MCLYLSINVVLFIRLLAMSPRERSKKRKKMPQKYKPRVRLHDLTADQMRDIIAAIQGVLWWDAADGSWDPDLEWSSDELPAIAETLARYGLDPSDDDHDHEPAEFEEGDLVTEDYIHFNEVGGTNNPVLILFDEETDWKAAVKEYMDEQKFWPNVWQLSDHGNYCLLSLEDK